MRKFREYLVIDRTKYYTTGPDELFCFTNHKEKARIMNKLQCDELMIDYDINNNYGVEEVKE